VRSYEVSGAKEDTNPVFATAAEGVRMESRTWLLRWKELQESKRKPRPRQAFERQSKLLRDAFIDHEA